MGGGGPRRREAHPVDVAGELLSVPFPLGYAWLVLGVLTVLEALNDLFGFAGPHWLYDNWFHNAILALCAVLVLARAAYEPIARPAWLAFGTALLEPQQIGEFADALVPVSHGCPPVRRPRRCGCAWRRPF